MLGRRLGPHRILYEILQALHHASILRDSLENPSRTAFPKQLWMLDNWLCLACDPVPVKNGVHQEMHKLNLYYVECAAGLALRHYDIAILSIYAVFLIQGDTIQLNITRNWKTPPIV